MVEDVLHSPMIEPLTKAIKKPFGKMVRTADVMNARRSSTHCMQVAEVLTA